jgi:hypothetical protein
MHRKYQKASIKFKNVAKITRDHMCMDNCPDMCFTWLGSHGAYHHTARLYKYQVWGFYWQQRAKVQVENGTRKSELLDRVVGGSRIQSTRV